MVRNHEALVGMIYDAAAEPAGWPDVLDAIVAHVGGSMGAMFFCDELASHATFEALTICGFPAASVAAYAAHYGRQDPRLLWSNRHLAAARAYADDREMAFAEVERSETYQDYYRPLDLGLCLGGSLFKEPKRQGFLAVHYALRRDEIGAASTGRFEALLPHVIRALQIHRRLAGVGQLVAGLTFALDHLPAPALLVRPDGGLIHANRAAMAMLAAPGAAICLRGGRLCPVDARQAGQLLRALQQAGDAARGDALPPGIVVLSKPAGVGHVALMAAAAPGSMVDAIRPILVFVGDDAARLQTDAAMLARQFALTPAEADVAAALGRGDAPEAVGARRASSVGTVRTQMKSIFNKLEVRTHYQLTSLLARSLAALRRSG